MNGGKIEYLNPLKRHYAVQLIGLLLLIITLVLGVGLLASALIGNLVGVILAVITSLICSLIIAVKFSKDAIEGAEFLARAILYVSSDSVGIAAPDSKSLPASQKFFAELANNVYEMASSSYAKSIGVENNKESSVNISEVLVQNSPLPVFVINSAGNIVFINPAAENYTYCDPEQALGKPFIDVLNLTFDTNQTLESWLKEAGSKVATDTQAWDRVKVTATNNKIRFCDMAVRFSKDNPYGAEVIIMLLDHTDKYLNDEHGIGTISMAVHELRTPITAMRGYIEVFEEELMPSLNAEQKQFMKALSAQAQQLGSFISNVQNFARIEENTMTLALKCEDWGTIVQNAVNDMQLRAQVRKKTILAKIPDNLPKVAVDKVTIYEVITNLLENAIKYTRSSEPIIISCKIKDETSVETTITDKGIGIPESLLGNLFERFYRSHRSSASIGGMGLGLYLSKSIITAHGGEIWVKSKEGHGSTFGFSVQTFDHVASQNKIDNNNTITRTANGWIKNHNLYRG